MNITLTLGKRKNNSLRKLSEADEIRIHAIIFNTQPGVSYMHQGTFDVRSLHTKEFVLESNITDPQELYRGLSQEGYVVLDSKIRQTPARSSQ